MRNAIRSSYASLLMPHCPVTVVKIYRDGGVQPLVFIICQPYIPLHLEEMIFYRFLAARAKKDLHATIVHNWPSLLIIYTFLPLFSYLFRYAAHGDRTRTAPLQRYTTNLHAMLHSRLQTVKSAHYKSKLS